jgi:WD40 repeat protein
MLRQTLAGFVGKVEAAFSADGKLLVTVAGSKKHLGDIRLWNALTGEALGRIDNAKELENVTTMALSPDGHWLVTGHGAAVDPAVPGMAAPGMASPDMAAPGMTAPGMPAPSMTPETVPPERSAQDKVATEKAAGKAGLRGKLLAGKTAGGRTAAGNAPADRAAPGNAARDRAAPGNAASDRAVPGRAAPGNMAPGNVAAKGKSLLKIWDLTKRTFVAEFPAAHSASISRIVFSRRGMLLASGDVSGDVRIWDFATRKPLPAQMASQCHPITGLAFDLYGDRIATADEERCIRVWHVDSAKLLATLELALGSPAAIRFTMDGKLLVGTTTAGGLFAWDAESYRPKVVLRAEGNPAGADGHGSAITCAATLWPDGTLFTGSSDKTVKAWDLKGHRFQATVLNCNGPVSNLAVSADGKMMAIGTGRYRKDFEAGELLLCPLGGRGGAQSQLLLKGVVTTSLAFSSDGMTLAACHVSSDSMQGLRRGASLIDLKTGRSFPLASSAPQSIAFSRDGQFLAVGNAGGEVDLWRIDASGALAAKPIVLSGHSGVVASVCFSPDGKTLASGGYDNNVKIWDVASGEELLTFKHNGAVETVRFSPNGQVLATADREATGGGVRLWRAPREDH